MISCKTPLSVFQFSKTIKASSPVLKVVLCFSVSRPFELNLVLRGKFPPLAGFIQKFNKRHFKVLLLIIQIHSRVELWLFCCFSKSCIKICTGSFVKRLILYKVKIMRFAHFSNIVVTDLIPIWIFIQITTIYYASHHLEAEVMTV